MMERLEKLRSSILLRRFVSVLLWAYFVWLLTEPTVSSRWLDFPVYWEAGKKAVLGLTVYDVPGHFQFKYSPLIALLLGKIFQAFTFETASVVFQKLMLLIWFGGFLRIAKMELWGVFLIVLFFGNALRLDLALGQMNAVVFALLWTLFGSLEHKKSWRVDGVFAVLFSFAVQLKLFSLVLIPVLIFRREWRKLGLGLLFIPLLSLGGVLISHGLDFALAENARWLSSLFTSTDELLLSHTNAGLLGNAVRKLGLIAGKIIWILAGIAYVVHLWRNRDRSLEWMRNRLLLAIALFNPLVWTYWILFSIPLFMEKARSLRDECFAQKVSRNRAWLVLFATLFILVAFSAQHARWTWHGGVLGALILVFCCKEELQNPERTDS